MATYQILYWQHIPLSIRATDLDETVRQTLSGQFEDILKRASEDYRQVMHSSEFWWSKKQGRQGSAAEVAAAVAMELAMAWEEESVLASVSSDQVLH